MAEHASLNLDPQREPIEPETKTARKRCDLCGLPVGRSRARQVVDGKTLGFCCPGCQHVFQILFNGPEGMLANFRETDLYRACVESGIIPRSEEDLALRQARIVAGEGDPIDSQSPQQALHAQELNFKVEGMWCTACVWLIEEVLKKLKGILDARVYFLSDTAQVKYLPQFLSPEEILTKISSLGYRASLFQDPLERSSERRDLLLRLGVSSFLTVNLMMISFALYVGFFQELPQRAVAYLSYPIWLLATPVILYGGFPILRRAFIGLRHMNTSMDTLISIGALSAYLYSIVQMTKGSLHLYFDTASMLVTLVLLGKYIETQAREKVSRGITDLYRLANQKVRLWTEGKERWVASDAVEPGDEFLVLSGERIPLDGQITSGRAAVDESILTGESRPVNKGLGDEVMGGTLVLEGELKLGATHVGRQSALGQMIHLMQEALGRKNPTEQLADRVIRWFVPVILALAACVVVYLWSRGNPTDEALLRAVTILVMACPCALGIATPLAKVAAIGVGRVRGILVQDTAALERAKDLDILIFDKTGTMTEGSFSLQDVIVWGTTKEHALRRVAAVEAHSDHFLAREILRKAREIVPRFEKAESFEAHEGLGVMGRVHGTEIAAGNRRFMGVKRMALASAREREARTLASKGETVVYFGWDGRVRGFMVFGDSLKRGAKDLVQRLRSKNIGIWLVSGDAMETARAVAEELGVDHFSGQALPKDKVEIIKSLQDRGRLVGMVGDGVNDAAALAQADIGFSLGTGSNIAQEASDIALLADDPKKVLEVLDISALTTKTIHQNLLFAFLYNMVGMPLAVMGILNPLVAVFAMFGSSLTVIGNTLRIFRNRSI